MELLKMNSYVCVVLSIGLLPNYLTAADLNAVDVTPVIFFDDTSAAATNPGADWRVWAEDNNDGGYFQIADLIGTNVTVFDIQHSGNNSNSFRVDDNGDISLANNSIFIDRSAKSMTTESIGLGTTTPVFPIHIANGNTPSIRLEQDGSSGFGAQSWDMAGNEANFFIRDVTNNSTVPFRIKPGSPSSSIFIKPEGVAIGGNHTPEANLHVRFSGANPTGLVQLIKLSANNTTPGKFSDAGFVLENAGTSGFSWAFRTLENTGGFAASKQGTGAKEFEVRNTTTVASNVELHLANGARNVGGQWLNASSRSYKKNINVLSSEDAMQALKGLKSVTFEFKRDKSKEQRVGFIAEDVPALLATKDRKTVDPLQIIAVLTKAVQVIQAEVKMKDNKITDLEAKISNLTMMQERIAKTIERSLMKNEVSETSTVNRQ